MSLEDVPEECEYVIGWVVEVKDFGATLNLIEFSEQKAFIHISEVASGWVKYIRDFIREGQMVVAKVTKVKKGSKVVDASVRQRPHLKIITGAKVSSLLFDDLENQQKRKKLTRTIFAITVQVTFYHRNTYVLVLKYVDAINLNFKMANFVGKCDWNAKPVFQLFHLSEGHKISNWIYLTKTSLIIC